MPNLKRFPEEWVLYVANDGWQYVTNDLGIPIGDRCHVNDCPLDALVEKHNAVVKNLNYELMEEYPNP